VFAGDKENVFHGNGLGYGDDDGAVEVFGGKDLHDSVGLVVDEVAEVGVENGDEADRGDLCVRGARVCRVVGREVAGDLINVYCHINKVLLNVRGMGGWWGIKDC